MGISDFDWSRFVDVDLRSRIGPGVTWSDYQLGNPGFAGHSYPAAGDFALLIEGMLPWFAPGGPYEDSVNEGRAELVAYMADRAVLCPDEVFILGGWSQGAQVIGEGLFEIAPAVRDRIAYVALFGDPKLDTGNFRINPILAFPPACWDGGRPWVEGSAPCYISGGIFGPRSPYLPGDIELRVGSWCTDEDPACNGSLEDIPGNLVPSGAHYRYFGEDSDSAVAARKVALALQIFLPSKATEFDVSWFQFASGATGADLVFVFDTTGSMGGEIADAKADATELANAWLEFFPNGRVALVQYRDHGDAFVSRLDLGLTNDVPAFQAALDTLTAGGGGDTPEAALSGLMTALNELDWRDGATKTAVLISDAPGKDPEPITGFTRDQVNQRALEIDPVAIYTVNVSTSSTVSSFFEPLATATAGEVFVLQAGESLADLLFEVLDVVAFNPVATLNGPYVAETGAEVRFSAVGSFDADSDLVSYEWDFDGDGTVDRTTATGTVQYTYPGPFDGLAVVRVIAADGGSALATAEVSVDSVGLAGEMPLAPVSASASVTGPEELTVQWTAAAGDRADGYKVYREDGTVVGFALAADPTSVVVTGVDSSAPVPLFVAASNEFGQSAGVPAAPAGGWQLSRPLNDEVEEFDFDPDAAIGGDDVAHVIWSHGGVFASRQSSADGSWTAGEVLDDGPQSSLQQAPAIAADAAGNAYAVWEDSRNGRTDIYFSKRSAATGTWSANVRVNSSTTFAAQSSPDIGVTPGGAAVAVWYRRETIKNKPVHHIYSARLAAGASGWAPEIKLTTETLLTKGTPKVAVGPDGSAHAIWTQPTSGDSNVWYARLAPGATSWTNHVKISDDLGTSGQSGADIAVDGSGTLTAAWVDSRTSPNQLRVRRKTTGGSWGSSSVVATGASSALSMSAAEGGRVMLTWVGDGVQVAEYEPATAQWTSPERVDEAPSRFQPGAVAISDSVAVVLWQQGRRVHDDDFAYQIRARTKAGGN